MADGRQPTIEQRSNFSSKDKKGQDIEFEAILRFYVKPTGEITVTAPGATQASRPTAVVEPQVSVSRPQVVDDRPPPPPPSPRPEDPPEKLRPPPEVPRTEEKVVIERAPSRKVVTEERIDREYSRRPAPSPECTIKQFIPDPCKAVDDAIKSIRNIYHSYFCTPTSENMNSPKNIKSGPTNVKSGPKTFNKIEREDLIENEEKYEM